MTVLIFISTNLINIFYLSGPLHLLDVNMEPSAHLPVTTLFRRIRSRCYGLHTIALVDSRITLSCEHWNIKDLSWNSLLLIPSTVSTVALQPQLLSLAEGYVIISRTHIPHSTKLDTIDRSNDVCLEEIRSQ